MMGKSSSASHLISGHCYLMNNELPRAYHAYQSGLASARNVCSLIGYCADLCSRMTLMFGMASAFSTIDMPLLSMRKKHFQMSSILIPITANATKYTSDLVSYTSSKRNMEILLP